METNLKFSGARRTVSADTITGTQSTTARPRSTATSIAVAREVLMR